MNSTDRSTLARVAAATVVAELAFAVRADTVGAAAVTPLTAGEDVLLADAIATGLRREGYAVDAPRFRDIVAVFREEALVPGVTAQVGTIDLSTARIVERIAFAHEKGFRVFQISLPSWGALNDDEVLTFFRDVCGAFPDSQFLHYNLPRAKRELTAADYRRVADEVPNLAATKNTGRTIYEVRRLMRVIPEIQHFFGEAQFPGGVPFRRVLAAQLVRSAVPGSDAGVFRIRARPAVRQASAALDAVPRRDR